MAGRSKYGAKPTVVDGHRFPSMAEARRYAELKLMERAGQITHLELQPKFPVVVAGVKIGSYVADFAYIDTARRGPQGQVGCKVVEDVKSAPTRTRLYIWKKKLVEALYPGVKIMEVSA